MIGSKFSRYFFNQSEVKAKPIVARACPFSRALCRLRVITSSFDWFTELSPSFLIGQSNYFGFGLRHSIETRSILHKSQIGFLANNRTADHVLTLRTLSNNYLHGHQTKVYACFVDFRKPSIRYGTMDFPTNYFNIMSV